MASVRAIERIADGVTAFSLALDDADRALDWRPGQFVSIACGEDAEGNPLLRSYSIASAPRNELGEILLIIKLVPGGKASTWLAALSVGARVRFTGPMGFFVNDLAHPGDVVYAATGVGVAPLLPMMRETLARTAESGHVHFFWGVRHEADLFWSREVMSLAGPRFSSTVHVSQPAGDWQGARGRITTPILELSSRLAQPTFYLCGSGAMITELKTRLVAAGVNRKKQIRTEAFFD